MATAIYNNCYTCWNGCPTNASNMGICLRSDLPDADAVGLARLTNVPDVDVIGARGKTYAGSITQRNITIAGGVVAERVKSNSRVTVAIAIAERPNTDSRIVRASRVRAMRYHRWRYCRYQWCCLGAHLPQRRY